ncbi:MAG: hybrid sensor histidine kinase/response regulator [Pegethrix bostrychoides GSE-TBD4-15B]|jgi:chemotaxis family two-component system sensor histidine kinase/response regulator PixL|uniref:histidine kinase n=1 Tax=Pegethrix bostrychoides GSE-TBD4-15B TaxID=2839662 RepID=A0A951U5A6_9CYAN|nr:hybrid sensor histidine kinase/response regulator [Pegethrix bostrychoides GSE-TBD4-15B]
MVSDFRPHESYQFFLQEVPELLQTLEAGLLDLQQDHSPTKMHSLMRAAHSIKGGAACVGLSQIQTLAHSLETVLKTCSRASLSVDLELESLMLQAFDCLKTPLMEEIHMGSSDDIAQAAVTNPIWRELEVKLSPRQSSNFLFAVDIEKGLQRLETILAQPADADILIALKAQLQIFRGLGELAQLPNFVASSERSLTALQQTPDQPRTIGESALAELRSLYAAQLDPQLDPQIPVADELDSAVAEWWDEYQASQYQANQYQANQYQANQYQASESLIGNTPEPIDAGLVSSLTQALLPAAQRSLNVRSDGTRLELLSNLVSELATQDNRFRSQHEQQVETIESMAQCFNRVRQLTVSLNRWSQQWSPPLVPLTPSLSPLPTSQPPARSISTKRLRRLSSRSRSQEYLQTTAQAVVEEMAQLGEAIQDLLLLDQRMQHLDKQKQKTLKQVQNNLFQAQMLPVSELFNQFPRMVRDLAIAEGKQVTLDLRGSQTLVDKAILEKLYDPLVHLLRNAFDHGIESPELRQAIGKPAQGKITIQAWHRGNQTYLEVQDDGQGIDPEQIRAAVVEQGLMPTAEAETLSPQRLYDYLFSPGFSTAREVSSLSGRGMGLYAVQFQVNALKGVVTLDSKLGRGTTFTLRLPLTLMITKLLVFSIQGNLLAIPVDMLEAITVAAQQQLQADQDQQFYRWQGRFVPIYPEALLLSYNYPRAMEALENQEMTSQRESWQKPTKFPLLLISHGEEVIALKVEQIVLEQDLMIKPFNDAVAPPIGLAGCTILADGRLAPVLDGPALIEKWLQFSQGESICSISAPPPEKLSTTSIPTVLVVDDSLTIRHALSTTLAKAGYPVLQAKDGWEAIAQLRLRSSIAAVICDIEMPRMNGLEFLSRCRQQGMTCPVIMLTYRSSEKYRQMAQQLGASAYLTKPYLDKELLRTLESCLALDSGSR